MKFEWDDEKAETNLSKHGVSFEEAQTVFSDPHCVDLYDPDHSGDEERYPAAGMSIAYRLLVVSYTERGNKTRLISAREMSRQEQKSYE